MDALVESMKRYKRFRRAQAMHLKAIASAVTGTVDAATAAAAAQAGDTAFHSDLGSLGANQAFLLPLPNIKHVLFKGKNTFFSETSLKLV